MSRLGKALLLLAVAGVVFIGGSLWFLDRTLGSGTCQTTVFTQTASQDGTSAKVQMTDCGATTGFSRVVMLEQSGLFAKECRALALRGTPNVTLAWQADGTLQIKHNAPASDRIDTEAVCLGHKIDVQEL